MNILVTQKHLTNSLIGKEEYVQLMSELCYRMPYGVKVQNIEGCVEELSPMGLQRAMSTSVAVTKPYLFPITEEQRKELTDVLIDMNIKALSGEIRTSDISAYEVDYYHINHIDYRGSIEKGLALDATGLF